MVKKGVCKGRTTESVNHVDCLSYLELPIFPRVNGSEQLGLKLISVIGASLAECLKTIYERYVYIMRGSRNFRQVMGGGGSRPICHEKALKMFLVLNLFYSSTMVISKKSVVFQGSRGGRTFSKVGGGGDGWQLFPGGSGTTFSRGVRTPCPPPPPALDSRMFIKIATKSERIFFISHWSGKLERIHVKIALGLSQCMLVQDWIVLQEDLNS